LSKTGLPVNRLSTPRSAAAATATEDNSQLINYEVNQYVHLLSTSTIRSSMVPFVSFRLAPALQRHGLAAVVSTEEENVPVNLIINESSTLLLSPIDDAEVHHCCRHHYERMNKTA